MTAAPATAAPPLADEDEGDGILPHVFFVLLLVLLVLFVAWAYYGRLAIVSTAVGEVIPSSEVKRVQHLEGGIVRDILVHEGERVKAGQPLVSLEPTRSNADVDELRLRLAGLGADIARLTAEQSGAARPTFPPDLVKAHPQLVASARGLFDARRAAFASKIRAAEEKVTEKEQSAEEIATRIANNEKRLKLLREQIAISKSLMQDQLTNRMRHLDLLRTEARLVGTIEEDRKALPRTQAAHATRLPTSRASRTTARRTSAPSSRRAGGCSASTPSALPPTKTR